MGRTSPKKPQSGSSRVSLAVKPNEVVPSSFKGQLDPTQNHKGSLNQKLSRQSWPMDVSVEDCLNC